MSEVEPLVPGTIVQRPDTEETGRLLGPFTRRGERWWTIQWGQRETTAEREADILND
jgi:hypothetical protein